MYQFFFILLSKQWNYYELFCFLNIFSKYKSWFIWHSFLLYNGYIFLKSLKCIKKEILVYLKNHKILVYLPVYPGRQTHKKPMSKASHDAPCWQGTEKQSLIVNSADGGADFFDTSNSYETPGKYSDIIECLMILKNINFKL